jgi:hypothetical protein
MGAMYQNQFSTRRQQRSASGCGRIAMFGGGCIVILLLGFVGLIVAGGFLWDRGTEAGGNFVSNWLSDQIATDISERVDAVEHVHSDLPEPRHFDNRDEYLHFLESYNREFAGAMERVAELVRRPELRDDDWADHVAREIALVRQLESNAREANPPAELETAHGHWTHGMGEYRRAIDATANAVDNLSISEFGEAVGALSAATQSYLAMAQSLDDMGALEDLQTIEELRQIEQTQ